MRRVCRASHKFWGQEVIPIGWRKSPWRTAGGRAPGLAVKPRGALLRRSKLGDGGDGEVVVVHRRFPGPLVPQDGGHLIHVPRRPFFGSKKTGEIKHYIVKKKKTGKVAVRAGVWGEQ